MRESIEKTFGPTELARSLDCSYVTVATIAREMGIGSRCRGMKCAIVFTEAEALKLAREIRSRRASRASS